VAILLGTLMSLLAAMTLFAQTIMRSTSGGNMEEINSSDARLANRRLVRTGPT
jgi:hypothetical protein